MSQVKESPKKHPKQSWASKTVSEFPMLHTNIRPTVNNNNTKYAKVKKIKPETKIGI